MVLFILFMDPFGEDPLTLKVISILHHSTHFAPSKMLATVGRAPNRKLLSSSSSVELIGFFRPNWSRDCRRIIPETGFV